MSNYSRITFQTETATTSSAATTNRAPVIGSYSSNSIIQVGTAAQNIALTLFTLNDTNVDNIDDYKLPYRSLYTKGVLYRQGGVGNNATPVGYQISYILDWADFQFIGTTSIATSSDFAEIYASSGYSTYLASACLIFAPTTKKITFGFLLTQEGIDNRNNLITKGKYMLI